MARPELGSKRQCSHCGAKFYDLGRDPAVCPKCGTVNQPMSFAVPSRAAAPAAARARVVEEPEVEPTGPEMVSLDEVEAAEQAPEAAGDDVEIGEDVGTDAFLEEEEAGEDDVTGLIDSDLEDDEEA